MENFDIDLTKFLDNDAIVYYNEKECCTTIKYKDLLKQIIRIGVILDQENVSRNDSDVIGIFCKKSPESVAFALAALESEHGFCYLSSENLSGNELDELGVHYFFSEFEHSTCDCRSSFELFGTIYRLYKVANKSMQKIDDYGVKLNRICYTVTTSGSTGKRKIVRVPFKCIRPNLVDLQKIFSLNNDVIYTSAPCTFDVFILDMLLSLHTGSTLLIISDNLRYSEKAIDLIRKTVTFMQMTPSLFRNYGVETIQTKLLHDSSALRILVLGGELFPNAQEVLTWQNWDSDAKKRIFNIYGVTEMSCWSMIHEVEKQDLIAGTVPLGKPLSETFCGYTTTKNQEHEEIVFLSSTRYCFIDGKKFDQESRETSQVACKTGDLVTKSSDGTIHFSGRLDDVVKKFGERISLKKIEFAAAAVNPDVVCVFTKKRIVLFCKTDDQQEIDRISDYLKNNLKSSEVPDNILKISFMPLSKNGKVDKLQLKLIFKEYLQQDKRKDDDIEDIFLEAINQIFNLKITKNLIHTKNNEYDEPDGKRFKSDMDLTFRALGGTSFDALRISMKMSDQVKISNSLLAMLLSDSSSIRDIYSYLKTQFNLIDRCQTNGKSKHHDDPSSVLSMKEVASFNLNKCVDANVNASQKYNLLSVGSHSHELITISMDRLELVSKTVLGDRIESEVSFKENYGYVGCYDGFLYCYELFTGQIMWKYDTQGKIKSKPVIIDDMVIVGNYGEESNLFCMRLNNDNTMPNSVWSRKIGSTGILANVLILNETIFVCTLDGIIELMSLDGKTIWSKNVKLPIFSSPQKIPNKNEIIFAEVASDIHCIDIEGSEIWSFKTNGEIFSSFTLENGPDNKVMIYFGCHDHDLRCLSYDTEKKTIEMLWKVQLQSQIFSTPKFCDNGTIVSCTTNGWINLIDKASGEIKRKLQLPGEVFSSPYVLKDKIFVGCRNNNLYCIEY